MPPSIVIAAAASANLDPAPITPAWILEGAPWLATSTWPRAGTRRRRWLAWECTPSGRFNWHMPRMRTIFIISGEVFIGTVGMGLSDVSAQVILRLPGRQFMHMACH